MMVRIALLLALHAGIASAGELEYGHDTLPVLTSDASVIVVIASVDEVVVADPTVRLFRLHVSDGVRGSFDGDHLLALHSRTTGSIVPPTTPRAFAFLSGPLPAEDLLDWGIVSSQPVYVIVGGPGGIVPITSPLRRTGVLEYIALGSPAATSASRQWSYRYLNEEDRLLQYSAIHQLYRFGGASDVLYALKSAITSNKLIAHQQQVALRVIAASGTDLSTELLKRIAEDNDLASEVRKTSVFEIDGLPGGLSQLDVWSKGSDAFLRPAAKEALARRAILPH